MLDLPAPFPPEPDQAGGADSRTTVDAPKVKSPQPDKAERQPESKAPAPYLENDSLKNRLVALTHQRFSIQTVTRGSGKLAMRALRKLVSPYTRRFVLPGEKNDAVKQAKSQLATLPSGTKGLFRTDGELIVASQRGVPLQAAMDEKLDLSRVYLVKADLSDKRLNRISMPEADLRLATLDKTSLDSAVLTGSDLRRARLERTKLVKAQMEECQFGEATLIKVSAEGASASKASFRASHITGGNFVGADLRDADFAGAKFEQHSYYDVWRERTYYSSISFRNADLRGARFSATANFDAMDLSGAKLDGVVILNRQGQVIEGAKLKNDGTVLYSQIPARPEQAQDAPRISGPTGPR